MNLKHLTGNELEKSTICAVSMDRKATAVVLAHVKEINHQKHYSSLGYRSPYDYLTRKHGYCAGSADRLIKAAAIIAVVPQAEVKLVQGEINLSGLAAVQKFAKDNDISDTKKKAQIIQKVQGKTKEETEKILFELLPEEKKKKAPKDTKVRINDKEMRISITVKDDLISKIQRYKSLSGKNLEDGEIFELAMDLLLEKEEHRKFKKLKESPPAEKAKSNDKLSTSVEQNLLDRRITKMKRRALPRKLERELYARAKYKCERCESDYRLQVNHKYPWSLGGEDSLENCNILCFNCNDKDRIDAKLVRKHAYNFL